MLNIVIFDLLYISNIDSTFNLIKKFFFVIFDSPLRRFQVVFFLSLKSCLFNYRLSWNSLAFRTLGIEKLIDFIWTGF